MGNIEWSQTYGKESYDYAHGVVESIDGGYAVAGISRSETSTDFWLVKIDTKGKMLWNKSFKRGDHSEAYSLISTSDGGYGLAGYSHSIFGSQGIDYWLVKTDRNGTMEWNQTYGGPENEGANAVVQTSDNGYAIAGVIESYGANNGDFWLVRTDQNGTMVWNRTLGAKQEDIATDLIQTDDGGFVLGGFSHQLIFRDILLVKTNSEGYVQWLQNYSGQGDVYATSLVQTVDNELFPF